MGSSAYRWELGATGVESLSRRDMRAALDFIALLGEAADLDDFGTRLAYGLDSVISCHGSSYNEIDLRRHRVRWITNLKTNAADVEAFEHHISNHPILMHFKNNPLASPVKMSDFVGTRAMQNLGVYRDVYRSLKCERVLAMEVAPRPVSIDIAAFRDGADFSERDRAMMTMLRPHLANVYRNVSLAADLGQRIELLHRGLMSGGLSAIMLGADGSVLSMSDEARTWLTVYFGGANTDDRLPEKIQAWLSKAESPGAGADGFSPLMVERGDARLVLRFLRHARKRLILMREERTTLRGDDLASLGLARREAEILAWVASGKTDGEVASILDISPRTVSHTLERIYRKLGVENRVAASRLALAEARSRPVFSANRP